MSKAFSYNNNKYEIDVSISTKEGEITHLIEENIRLFEYTNTVNDIVHEGSVEYIDTDQRLDKFLDKMICYCTVVFSQIETEADGEIQKKNILGTLSVTFFVNNIGILENKPNAIIYKLFLVSRNWVESIKNVDYTNYGEEKEPVLKIIQNVLGQSGFKVDADSFDKLVSTTTLNYITNKNDDVVTTIRYLLNKTQFSESYNLDSSVKCIVYDEYKDIIHAFDTCSSSEFQQVFPVTVNQLETEVDPIFNTTTNLAFNVKQNKTDLMRTLISNQLYNYSLELNDFSQEEITTQNIVNFYSGHQKDTNIDTIIQDAGFAKSQMRWNNNINIYMDQMKNLTQYGSLILNTAGFLGLIPGCKIIVSIPVPSKLSPTWDKKMEKQIENVYQSMCGYWVVSSVKNFINSSKGIFRQNISLMRNIKSPSSE